MRTLRAPAAGLALLAAILWSADASACGDDSDCRVEGGTYRVHVSPSWDGRRPLPAALFFHGYRGSAAGVMADRSFVDAFDRIGVLLVAPNGLGGSWAHQGSPSRGRDELAFVNAVLDDLERRFPVDAARLWAMGFSQGGSMVWDLACEGTSRFAAFVAVSGAFWEPIPQACAEPFNLLHIHGLSDNVVPLEGRRIRETFKQGDVFAGFAVLRAVDGCRSNPAAFEPWDAGVCRIWSDCTSSRQLRMCLHPGGHTLDPAWVRDAWHWVRQITGSGG